MPLARDYSTLAYPGAGAAYCNNPQQAPISLERPSSRNPNNNGNNSQANNAAGQDGSAGSRMSSASSSDNGGGGGGGGGGGAPTAGGGSANPLLSPCSVMEEASSPGSTTSQLSYLGALQSPAASLAAHGFSAPYLLAKDSSHVVGLGGVAGVGGAAGGPGVKKKEPKPGSDVRSFGCQVNFYNCNV